MLVPVPPKPMPSRPPRESVPVVVTGEPVNVRPVEPPEAPTEVTPVLAMTPVDELYEMPVPAERLVDASLPLKFVQSAEARNWPGRWFAWLMPITPPE